MGRKRGNIFPSPRKGPTSNSALVRAVLMCLTSSRVRLRVPSSPILLPFLFSSTTSGTSSSSLSEASSSLKQILKTFPFHCHPSFFSPPRQNLAVDSSPQGQVGSIFELQSFYPPAIKNFLIEKVSANAYICTAHICPYIRSPIHVDKRSRWV